MTQALGLSIPLARVDERENVEHVVVMHPLRRVLAFTRRSIDQVINDPIARNEVRGFYKLYRWIDRRAETLELERQWNPNGAA
jgi:hypothetical protein